MIEPKLFDTVELLVDLPEYGLRAGARGAIVHQHTNEVFEVEFVNEEGETLALCALPYHQFIVVWRAESRQWVPVAEQVAQIIARLPQDARTEVLDFARFLSMRTQEPRPRMVQRAAVQDELSASWSGLFHSPDLGSGGRYAGSKSWMKNGRLAQSEPSLRALAEGIG